MKSIFQTIAGMTFLCLLFLCACQEGAQEQTSNTATAPAVSSAIPDIEVLNQKLAEDPQNPQLYAARARAYYEHDGYDEAIDDLNNALRLDTSNVAYMHLLADVYLDYFKSSYALKTMERVVELYPKRIPSLLKLAEFQLILKKHDESLQTIERILKQDALNGEAFYMTGRVFEDMGEMDKAIRSYEKAVDSDPDLSEVWMKLGSLFAERKDPNAIRYFDNAILVDSANIDAHFNKASYLHNRGELQKAIATYRNIHRIAPQMADAYYNCGLAYMELDSLDHASAQFDLTVKMKPTHIMGYYYRGVASEMKGDLTKAKNDFKQALNLAPNFERAQQALQKLESVN